MEMLGDLFHSRRNSIDIKRVARKDRQAFILPSYYGCKQDGTEYWRLNSNNCHATKSIYVIINLYYYQSQTIARTILKWN